MPMEPATAGPRSLRMSPNRLEPTTTSNQSGCCTKCAHRMSIWNWSVRMSGYSCAIAAKRSSQYGMVKVMPFDLVAEVRCFFGRVRASSKANFRIRSTPWRVKTLCCETNSRSVPSNMRPPTDGVFALGVLAHHVEVDIRLGAIRERRAHARHQLAGTQVGVLVEAAADRDQQAPQRDVVRHARPADRAQQDKSPTAPAAPCRRPASSRRSACRSRTTSRSARSRGRSRSGGRRHPAPSAPPAPSPCRSRRRERPRSCGSSP